MFIIENVKGILTMKDGQVFNEIKNIFEDPLNFEGRPYKIQYKVLKQKNLEYHKIEKER